jgi:NAD(P)-dependent dehydrogenase (short-subunit alcohol dehydrogenase family)
MRAIVIGANEAPTNIGGMIAYGIERMSQDAARTTWTVDAPDEMDLDATSHTDIKGYDWKADALVYSAGFCEPNWIWESSFTSIQRQVEVNLTGALQVVSRFVRDNLDDTEGRETYRRRIILIGSRAAETPHRGQSPYNAAKAGLRAVVGTLAREIHPHGFRIFLIEPGAVDGTAYGPRVAEGARRMGLDDRAGAVRGTFGRNIDPSEVAQLAAEIVVRGTFDWMAGAPIPYGGGPQ